MHVDRPLGSMHPQFDTVYPLNYGWVEGILAGDGEPLDAYVLGVSYPVMEFTGICIGIVHRLNDVEDKLIVAPNGCYFSEQEINEKIYFQEQYFEYEVIVAKR